MFSCPLLDINVFGIRVICVEDNMYALCSALVWCPNCGHVVHYVGCRRDYTWCDSQLFILYVGRLYRE